MQTHYLLFDVYLTLQSTKLLCDPVALQSNVVHSLPLFRFIIISRHEVGFLKCDITLLEGLYIHWTAQIK